MPEGRGRGPDSVVSAKPLQKGHFQRRGRGRAGNRQRLPRVAVGQPLLLESHLDAIDEPSERRR